MPKLSQEQIVFAIWVVLFVAFSIFLPNFLTYGNIISLVRSVSVLGILGIGMAIVVIGRGIDLSIIAVMAMSVAWSLNLMQGGAPLWVGLLAGVGFAVAAGLISGVLIAYGDIPPLFATLAMGAAIYGFGRFELISQDIIELPATAGPIAWVGGGYLTVDSHWHLNVTSQATSPGGAGNIVGVPVPILMFIGFAILTELFLSYAKVGRFIYSSGDNPLTARITGLPVRPLIVMQYVIAALFGFAGGLITATGVNSMNTRIVISTMLYDVILVVILGGISLSGGKGGVRNVIVGTLLIGTLLNGMTILDVQYTMQNVVKSLILLTAIVVDSIVNPRDEQTAQQGDI